MVSFYEWQLALLGSVCAVLMLFEKRILQVKATSEAGTPHGAPPSIVSGLSRRFLVVYGIVMGADWLQGPYIYSLYREQYGLSEHLVALLFVLGFLTAGVAAPFVGIWADQYGRKLMCMVFCVTYATACVFIQFPYLLVLFVGRLLGGFSTAILYSSFEAWLVTSANTLSLSSRDLSTIFGRATLVSSILAIVAGVASNKLVDRGSFTSPFLASGACLVLGWAVIGLAWSENRGSVSGPSHGEVLDLKRLSEAWHVVRADKRLLVLGLTQTCFEGAMYLFVFLWVPCLQEAVSPLDSEVLPLGYIFASLMTSMTLGSIIYTVIISFSRLDGASHPDGTPIASSHERVVALHAKLSSVVCAAGALAFIVSVTDRQRHVRFWAFCAFEVCVGMFYPVQGMLRGRLVTDEHRATLSSLFRVPLNIFVTISLLTGVQSARQFILSTCAGLLLCSAVVTAVVFLPMIPTHSLPPLASLRTS